MKQTLLRAVLCSSSRLMLPLVPALLVAQLANADTTVYQMNFQSPGTSLGPNQAGSSVGNPDSAYLTGDPASVVSCNAPGSITQCLQLSAASGTVAGLVSNMQFGGGDYELNITLATGPNPGGVEIELGSDNGYNIGFTQATPFQSYMEFATVNIEELNRFSISTNAEVLVANVSIVSLSDVSMSTPEPATWSLLAFSAVPAGLLLIRRYLFRNRVKIVNED